MKPDNSRLKRHLVILALPVIGVLAMLSAGFALGAACTAANPNASMAESTPTSAFTVHGDDTATHNLTGLMWKRCVEGRSGASCATGAATPMTWSAAHAAAVADRTGGYADWRVPNRNELQSIIESCGWGPAINQTIFPATPGLGFPDPTFYTSTTYLPGPSRAVGISFLDGFPFILTKTFPFSVRLVRGGRNFGAFDAQPSLLTVTRLGTGSGTVTSNPLGIDCGATCSALFGAQVTLTAAPAPGSVFTGWLGACTGVGPCILNINGATNVSATFAPDNLLLGIDIDGNGSYDALTDGLLLIRYLFGRTGAALTAGAIDGMPPRSTPLQIAQYVDDVKPLVDVDGDGRADALTDGLMLLRHLFGLRGASLIDGAIAGGATRTSAMQIEAYILTLKP
ncbi:MAG: DUF1566 domain-containing protein [Burkholderiales bacterium]|nr:DUF1566 domain-containing protein [Burkholderiales bacterium]